MELTLVDFIYDAVRTHRSVVGVDPNVVLVGAREREELHGFDTVANLKIVAVNLPTFVQVIKVPE